MVRFVSGLAYFLFKESKLALEHSDEIVEYAKHKGQAYDQNKHHRQSDPRKKHSRTPGISLLAEL